MRQPASPPADLAGPEWRVVIPDRKGNGRADPDDVARWHALHQLPLPSAPPATVPERKADAKPAPVAWRVPDEDALRLHWSPPSQVPVRIVQGGFFAFAAIAAGVVGRSSNAQDHQIGAGCITASVLIGAGYGKLVRAALDLSWRRELHAQAAEAELASTLDARGQLARLVENANAAGPLRIDRLEQLRYWILEVRRRNREDITERELASAWADLARGGALDLSAPGHAKQAISALCQLVPPEVAGDALWELVRRSLERPRADAMRIRIGLLTAFNALLKRQGSDWDKWLPAMRGLLGRSQGQGVFDTQEVRQIIVDSRCPLHMTLEQMTEHVGLTYGRSGATCRPEAITTALRLPVGATPWGAAQAGAFLRGLVAYQHGKEALSRQRPDLRVFAPRPDEAFRSLVARFESRSVAACPAPERARLLADFGAAHGPGLSAPHFTLLADAMQRLAPSELPALFRRMATPATPMSVRWAMLDRLERAPSADSVVQCFVAGASQLEASDVAELRSRLAQADPLTRARSYVNVCRALEHRTDTAAGVLRQGLLTPEGVRELVDQLAALEKPPAGRPELMAGLMQLCQTNMTPALLRHTVATLARLPEHAPAPSRAGELAQQSSFPYG